MASFSVDPKVTQRDEPIGHHFRGCVSSCLHCCTGASRAPATGLGCRQASQILGRLQGGRDKESTQGCRYGQKCVDVGESVSTRCSAVCRSARVGRTTRRLESRAIGCRLVRHAPVGADRDGGSGLSAHRRRKLSAMALGARDGPVVRNVRWPVGTRARGARQSRRRISAVLCLRQSCEPPVLRPSVAETVGDRVSPFAPKCASTDLGSRGCLLPLPLRDANQSQDVVDQLLAEAGSDDLGARLFLIDVPEEQRVQDIVGR